MRKKFSPFILSTKEKIIETIGITVFASVLIGSALKLLFL